MQEKIYYEKILQKLLKKSLKNLTKKFLKNKHIYSYILTCYTKFYKVIVIKF